MRYYLVFNKVNDKERYQVLTEEEYKFLFIQCTNNKYKIASKLLVGGYQTAFYFENEERPILTLKAYK